MFVVVGCGFFCGGLGFLDRFYECFVGGRGGFVWDFYFFISGGVCGYV